MENVLSFLNQIPNWMKPVGIAISVIMLIAAGITMTTGHEGMGKGKKHVVYILIGVAVILLAASIIASVQSSVSG